MDLTITAQVRRAESADAAAVADVLIESRRVFLPYLRCVHSPAQIRQWVIDHLVPSGGVHVVEQDGRIAAVLAISEHDGVSWIDQLYVFPGYEAQGLGTRLLAFAHQTLRAPIRLYTFQANAGARRFYERHGYRAIRFSDGSANAEQCPDVLYERGAPPP